MSDLIDRKVLLHKAWLAFYAHEDEMEKKDPDYLLMKRLYEQNGFEIFHSTVVNAPTIEPILNDAEIQQAIEIMKVHKQMLEESPSNQLEGDKRAFELAIKALGWINKELYND